MILDRLRADVQLAGDHRVVLAVRDQLEHLDLSVGQLGADRLGDVGLRARSANALQHLAGDVRRDQRLPDRGSLDAGHQLLDRRVLHQITACAGEDRVEYVRVLVGDRQHDDPRQRCDGRHLSRGLDSGHPRHVEVHHDDVRSELAHQPHGLDAVRGLADDLDALFFEQVTKSGAEEVVVVDEQHPNRACGLHALVGCLERLGHFLPSLVRDPPPSHIIPLIQRDRHDPATPGEGLRGRREP